MSDDGVKYEGVDAGVGTRENSPPISFLEETVDTNL